MEKFEAERSLAVGVLDMNLFRLADVAFDKRRHIPSAYLCEGHLKEFGYRDETFFAHCRAQ